MQSYNATVRWLRGDQAFTDNKYSRAHDLIFDGGAIVRGSSAPSSVPLPYSDATAIDPEEALVAATSSCHMLFFLAFAAKRGLQIDSYDNSAVGIMTKNQAGKFYISKITLSPRIVFSGDKRTDAAEIAELHHRAHQECYIAHSIRADIVIAEVPPLHT